MDYPTERIELAPAKGVAAAAAADVASIVVQVCMEEFGRHLNGSIERLPITRADYCRADGFQPADDHPSICLLLFLRLPFQGD